MISLPKNVWGINHFQIMVDQLGTEYASHILGIHRTTLKRYYSGKVRFPRAFVAALYWETNWGRGQIDSDHRFEVQLLHFKIEYLRKENSRLVDALKAIEQFADLGSANAPVLQLQKMR